MKNLPPDSSIQGDLNNTQSARATAQLNVDQSYLGRSFAVSASADDAETRKSYRPFLIADKIASDDWIAKLELSTVLKMMDEELEKNGGDRLKVMVLYGSMRKRYEIALIAFIL
jgi:arsenic resistance protein ArsH